MDDQINQVMILAGVSRHDAMFALKEHGSVIEAVSALMIVPTQVGAPKQKVMDETQTFFTGIRKTMETLTESVHKGFISSDQSDSSVQVSMPSLPEETVQQSSCSEKCHLASLESGAQTQGTVCQSLSGCSCDSQSNDQT
jgi:hypothetical protein